MASNPQTLEEMRRINADFPYTDPIKGWKGQGKKVIGWMCCGNYIPEEIIYAAGMLPVRITGNSQEIPIGEANAYLHAHTCSTTRSYLELALNKELNFLDGLVTVAICDRTPRFADIWERYIPDIPLIYVLSVPCKCTPLSYNYYLERTIEFKERLEKAFKVEITEEALSYAIAVYNKSRELFHRLYNLKKLDNPPISGAETLEVFNASVRMPKERFNQLLEQFIDEIVSSKRDFKGKARLMVQGSILNNSEFIRGIEELGGVVVLDGLVSGLWYMGELVDDGHNIDLIGALCKRYLSRFSHPRMYPTDERIDQIVSLAKEFRVDGVIMETVRYCNPYIWENPRMRSRLESEGFPVMELDVEYGMPATGQIKTRVQAFMEMLLA